METLVSQQSQLQYQDLSRPGSSSSTASSSLGTVPYCSPSQQSLPFHLRYHPHQQQQQLLGKDIPGSSLQITTANSHLQDHDADEQTAHPSRMQPQFPIPQQLHQTAHTDLQSIKSSMMTGLSRPLNHREQDFLSHLDRLKFFLATAPSRWNTEDSDASDAANISVRHPSSNHPALNRFLLPNSEYVSCVLWGGLYHITGTDIVRALVFRFEAFGRPVKNMKKFEEGVFSDLRNLKPGTDACLEEPKSPFLDLLFKFQCIRTQKKQKVFYWFSVPHDRLFLDALERDLKREKMGLEPTTCIVGEPALSFRCDSKRSLYEQFCKAQGGYDGEGELEAAVRRADEMSGDADDDRSSDVSSADDIASKKKISPALLNNTPFASMFSLFEGSPTYKQRRKKTTKKGSSDASGRSGSTDDSTGPYFRASSQRDTDQMNAADMFMAQARESRAVAIQVDQQQVHNQSARGRLESRNTYPSQPQVYAAPNDPHRPQSHHGHTTLPVDWPFMDTSQNTGIGIDQVASSTSYKVFICPLFSCRRMFKRMEHLKRHLRTHTMERPFQCVRCNKKFSRSDNLNQHTRIHMRMDADGITGSAAFGMVEDGTHEDSVSADGEDGDELDGDSFLPDLRSCEVEVQGNFHDVHGDEEGLVTTDPASIINSDAGTVGIANHQDAYYSGVNNVPRYPLSSSPEPAAYTADNSPGVEWIARSAPSPAFSSVSMPSPQLRMSSVGQISSYNAMGEYISVSAPSHRATFDHGSIYPNHLMSPGPGPVRRHRSVTPSIARYGESIRRPYSAATTDGSPAATHRPFHPYAIPSSSHSTSAQSSPGSYNVPLEYGSVARSASISRPGSGHLQEQLSQMLNLDSMETDSMGYSNGNGYGGIYRTDSPGSYGHASGSYATNADGSPGHASTVDSQSIYAIQYGGQPTVDHSIYGQGHAQSVPM